jgi:hypothetical protein
MMAPSRNVVARTGFRLLLMSTAAVLTMPLVAATPARAQASPNCFKVCSGVFYKHVASLMKCAYKGVTDGAASADCATKAAGKMHDKYVVKLQGKCGDAACVTAYPNTRDVGCEALVFSTANAAHAFFGDQSVPLDTVTRDAIISAGVIGCGY